MCATWRARKCARAVTRERATDRSRFGQTRSYERLPASNATVFSCRSHRILLALHRGRTRENIVDSGHAVGSRDRTARDATWRLGWPALSVCLSVSSYGPRLSTVARDDAFAGIGRGADTAPRLAYSPFARRIRLTRVSERSPYDRFRELRADRTQPASLSFFIWHDAARGTGPGERAHARADYLSRGERSVARAATIRGPFGPSPLGERVQRSLVRRSRSRRDAGASSMQFAETTLSQAWSGNRIRGPQCAFEMSMFMCPAVHKLTRN